MSHRRRSLPFSCHVPLRPLALAVAAVLGVGSHVPAAWANGSPAIQSTVPAANAVNIPRGDNVVMTFNSPATLTFGPTSTGNFMVWGSQTAQYPGTFAGNGTTLVTFDPSSATGFKPGERIQLSYSATGARKVWEFVAAATGGSGSFADSGQTLDSSGNQTRHVALGDVTGDGHLDLVIGNWGGDSKLWLNNGSGTFTLGQNFGTANIRSLALGDVDGDGDLDLLLGGANIANKLWLNNGTGTFAFNQSFGNEGVDYTLSLALGDVDGDGDLDLVQGNYNLVSPIWVNNGSGTFSSSGGGLAAHKTYSIAMGDVDGDGDLDLVQGNQAQPNRVWLNDGSGSFASGQILGSSPTFSVALGDVDGDDDLDLVVGILNQPNEVWRNANGTFALAQTLQSSATTSVALGDVDADGDLDVVEGNAAPPNRVWLNNGSGTFSDSGQSLDGHDTRSVALGDVDADGDLDLVEANYGTQPSRVWFNQPKLWTVTGASTNTLLGTLSCGTTIADGGTLACTASPASGYQLTGASGDSTLCGTVTWSGTSISGAPVTGNCTVTGTFGPVAVNFAASTPRPNATSAARAGNLAIGLGGTGITLSELTNTQTLGNLAIHAGFRGRLSGGSFSNQGTTLIDYDPAANFLPGEKVALSYTGSGEVWEFIAAVGGGHANFGDSGQTLGNHSTRVLALGDLNGDGHLDLVEGTTGNAFAWLNNGSGTFTVGQTLAGTEFRSLALGDVDGDGDLDLLTKDEGSDALLLWSNTSGTFAVSQTLGTFSGTARGGLALGDLDGDGDLDLVEGKLGAPSLIWRNNGGTFVDSAAGLTSSDTFSVALGDVDGDGDLDLVRGTYNTTLSNELWRNDGGTFTLIQSLAKTERTTSLILGDVNGDRFLDLIEGNINGSNQGAPNRVWLNDTSGQFITLAQTFGANATWSLALGDVDGDGDLDLIEGNASQANRVWLNDGSGTFTDSGQSLGNHQTSMVALGDLDADGDLDLVEGNYSGQPNRVWFNQPTTWTVTGQANNANYGSLSCNPTQVANNGTLSCTAYPASGYQLTGVSGDTTLCGTVTRNGNNISGSPVTGNCTVTGAFTATGGGGGGGGPPPIPGACGSADGQILTAAPTSGLCDAGNPSAVNGTGPWDWSCAGTNGGTTATCGAPIQTYPVGTAPGAGGSITPPSQTVNHGATAAFTIQPNPGYATVAASGCGGALSGSDYRTGPIVGACTVSASFEQLPPANGQCGTANGQTLTAAPTANLCVSGTASPVSGTGPWNWNCAGINGGTAATCGAAIQTYPVSTAATPPDAGALAPSGATVKHGATVSFMLVPADGYAPTGASGCGGNWNGGMVYTTGPITGGCLVTATFGPPHPFPLTVDFGTGDGDYAAGTQVALAADLPPEGEIFAAWTGDAAAVANPLLASTVLTMPAAPATVTATYQPQPPTLFQLDVESGEGDGRYRAGTLVPIAAAAEMQQITPELVRLQLFDRWVGQTAGVANVYLPNTHLTMPEEPVTVTATYKPDPSQTFFVYQSVWFDPYPPAAAYLAADDGPTVRELPAGSVASLSAPPAPSGQVFAGWVGDTEWLYTPQLPETLLYMPDQDLTVIATYRAAPAAVTLTVEQGTGSGIYAPGTAVPIAAATAPPGQLFAVWTGQTASVANVNLAETTLTLPGTEAAVRATWRPAPDGTFPLTVVDGAGDGDYAAGAPVTLDAGAAPAAGRIFRGWTGQIATVAEPLAPRTTLTMPPHAATVVADWIAGYRVTASAGAGGALIPAEQGVPTGTAATIAVTPDSGYAIDRIDGCGGALTDPATYTTAPVSANCAVSATFKRQAYAVTASAGPGGAIVPASQTIEYGRIATLTLAPNPGYDIAAVSGCGGTLNGTAYTTAPIAAACAVTASFAPKRYTVTATAGPGGVINPASQTVAHGTAADLTLIPYPNYGIAEVSGCGGTLAGTDYTTGLITADCTVTARFALDTHTVTASAGPGGAIAPASQTVEYGAIAALTLTPDLGHGIAKVSGCGGTLNGTAYSTAPITADCAVTASFALNAYTVTASAGLGGAIAPARQTVEYGATAALTLTPGTGYGIAAVSGCGGTLAGTEYTTGPIAADCAVTASFARNAYTVTASAGPGGAIEPARQTVNHGATAALTLTPDPDYRVSAVAGTCGGARAGETGYVTAPVVADCAVDAAFAIACDGVLGPDTDGDGAPDTVEEAQGSDPAVKDNDVFGNVAAFIAQNHRDLLQREADADEVTAWTAQLQEGLTRGALLEALFQSKEFNQGAGGIARLYRSALGRPAGLCELRDGTARWQQGVTLETLAAELLAGAEFQALGLTDDAAFVDWVYRNTFGRAPQEYELAAWLAWLNHPGTWERMLATFLRWPAALAALLTPVTADLYDLGFLARGTDPATAAAWAPRLDSEPRDQVHEAFQQSPDYMARVLGIAE